jgi:predicted SAM-dependent methyltransferase
MGGPGKRKFERMDRSRVTIPLDDEVCDAAFSCHVFQHFESHKDAFAAFREVHRVLREDGSLMIHLPVYQFPDIAVSALFKPAMRLQKRLGDVRADAASRKEDGASS